MTAFKELFRRASDYDPDGYDRLMRMPMVDALPFVEEFFKGMVDKVEQAKKAKANARRR
jgi:hypothetical protein